MTLALQLGAILFGLAGACFWLWSALISVPDNLDTFIYVLQHQGRISRWAAVATAASVLSQAFSLIITLH